MNWHIITYKRNAMKTAIASLQNLGHEVYPPRERISVIRLNRRIKVERSLLYEYLFLGVEQGSEFYPIRKARGVFNLLDDIDGNPAQISEHTVERFRIDERHGKHDHTRRGNGGRPFDIGQPVMCVQEGLWDGYQGSVEKCGPKVAHVDLGWSVKEFRVGDLVAV